MLGRLRELSVPRVPVRLPPRTVRLRLTALYASLFLACGTGLLAVTYLLVREATGSFLVATHPNGSTFVIGDKKANGGLPLTSTTKHSFTVDQSHAPHLTAKQLQAQAGHDRQLAERQHADELHQLLEQSGTALALMAMVSIALGWFAAGRVLRPLRTMTDRVREISASNLHERLVLDGPADELTELGGTFDELLSRLEAAFTAQRQFVANASHELRSPLARARTLAEIAVDDPDATVESLRNSHRRVIAAGAQQERLIEALLTLARSERGLERRTPVDLAAITAGALHARHAEAERRGVYIHATLEPAETAGDAHLVERLVANLIDNALRHNVPHGQVDVTTSTTAGRAVVSVANSGAVIPPSEVERLFQPFQRLGRNRTDHGDGVGLGLSIVHAIAMAHRAVIGSHAQPGGGLEIDVSFPARNPGRGERLQASEPRIDARRR